MNEFVNEVLEQMNDKYVMEAANYQVKKNATRPRVLAAALVAACLMGVTALAYSQGWVFEKGGPEVWQDEALAEPAVENAVKNQEQTGETAETPAIKEETPLQEHNYRVHFTTEPYDKFTDEQMAFLDTHYGEKLTYADFAETKEALGLELFTLKNFAEGEPVTVDIKGRRSGGQYQVLVDYELTRPEENLRVIADVSLNTGGVQQFSVGGSYARPLEETEYWIETLGVNAKLVSAESRPTHAASVVWAYFTYDNMTYALQIIDKDVPAEKMAEACALLETLYK